MDKKLFRNEHDKVIAGVSSGIAEYMEVDATIIRLLFVLSTIFLVGTGVLVYLIMWILVPTNHNPTANFSKFNDFFKDQNFNRSFETPQPQGQREETSPTSANPETVNPGQNWNSSTFGDTFNAPQNDNYKFVNKTNDTGRTVGGLFLLVIGIYFLMNEFDLIPYWFRIAKLWPLIFVAIGISFILKSKRKNTWEELKNRQPEQPTPAEPVKPEAPQHSQQTDSDVSPTQL